MEDLSREICKMCGKEFYRFPHWAYKTQNKPYGYYCSWHCLNGKKKAKKQQSEKEKSEVYKTVSAKRSSTYRVKMIARNEGVIHKRYTFDDRHFEDVVDLTTEQIKTLEEEHGRLVLVERWNPEVEVWDKVN